MPTALTSSTTLDVGMPLAVDEWSTENANKSLARTRMCGTTTTGPTGMQVRYLVGAGEKLLSVGTCTVPLSKIQ